jgi:hypothetical protein
MSTSRSQSELVNRVRAALYKRLLRHRPRAHLRDPQRARDVGQHATRAGRTHRPTRRSTGS